MSENDGVSLDPQDAGDVDDAGDAGDPTSLALTVCRLGLDPVSGRIPNARQLGVAIRTALFVGLIRQGRVIGTRVPQAIGPSDTEDRLGDAVHRAIAARRPTPWRRWFSHTDADLSAATEALVSLGFWQPVTARRFHERQPRIVTAQAELVKELVEATQRPQSVEEAVLALLVVGAGRQGSRPRPRQQLGAMTGLLGPLLLPDDPGRAVVSTAVRAGLTAMRGRRLLGSGSGRSTLSR
jgi:hypothetical protein